MLNVLFAVRMCFEVNEIVKEKGKKVMRERKWKGRKKRIFFRE